MGMLDFDPFPIEISVAVFDLLPEGKLASLGWYTGCGLYHSAIRVQNLDVEYAFGGHQQPQTSGVFGVPCGPQDPILPGLRFRKLIPLGTAFGGAWRRSIEQGEHEDGESDRAQLLAHMQPDSEGPSRTGDQSSRPTRQETREETLQRIFSIIEAFQRDHEWDGPSYDLLTRNCNHFSEALAFTLTGQHIPAWINRAAWIGLQLPCIVPMGWVEPPEAQLEIEDQSESPQARQTASYDQQAQPQLPRLDRSQSL